MPSRFTTDLGTDLAPSAVRGPGRVGVKSQGWRNLSLGTRLSPFWVLSPTAAGHGTELPRWAGPADPEGHEVLEKQPGVQVSLAQHGKTRDPGVEGACQVLASLPSPPLALSCLAVASSPELAKLSR